MKLITFHNVDQITPTNAEANQDTIQGKNSEQIFQQYADLFTGIGCIATPYHIKMDKDATPVVHPPRKIPATQEQPVKEEQDGGAGYNCKGHRSNAVGESNGGY